MAESCSSGGPTTDLSQQKGLHLEEVSLPRLSSLDHLAIKLRALRPGQTLRIETLQSVGYQWDETSPDLPANSQSPKDGFHEPIATFKMCFDGDILLSGRNSKWGRVQPLGKGLGLIPTPIVPREPRSLSPRPPPIANPPMHRDGSCFLADFIAPGCERLRSAFKSISLLALGSKGMSALEAFHAERADRPSVFPPPINWEYWRAQSAEFASLRPFTPFEPITPILQDSDISHRAIELHCIFTTAQCYFRATPEPPPLSSHGDADSRTLTNTELAALRLTTEEAMSLSSASDQLSTFGPVNYGYRAAPLALSHAQTLMLLHLAFEKLANGISESLPVHAVVGGLLSKQLCNFESGLAFQMGKSFHVMLDEYNSSIDEEVHTHRLDITQLHLEGATPYARSEELLRLALGALPTEPNLPYFPTITREVLREVRPPVYDETEKTLIINAATLALTLIIKDDFGTNGPRAGTRPFKHLLEVGLLLMLSGERPEVVVAGLLHDFYELYEAHKPAKELTKLRQTIRERFGEEVDNLIAAVTEPPKGPRDSNEFFSRKSAIIKKLNSVEPPLRAEAARILCASKISTLLDGLIFIYEKGTTKGWSSGTWAQNVALHTFLLKIFEANSVSSALTTNYRAQLVKLAGWARRMEADGDLTEIRSSLAEYFARLAQCTHE